MPIIKLIFVMIALVALAAVGYILNEVECVK